jgi:hypothetical protein
VEEAISNATNSVAQANGKQELEQLAQETQTGTQYNRTLSLQNSPAKTKSETIDVPTLTLEVGMALEIKAAAAAAAAAASEVGVQRPA